MSDAVLRVCEFASLQTGPSKRKGGRIRSVARTNPCQIFSPKVENQTRKLANSQIDRWDLATLSFQTMDFKPTISADVAAMYVLRDVNRHDEKRPFSEVTA